MGYEHREDSQQMDDRNDPKARRAPTEETVQVSGAEGWKLVPVEPTNAMADAGTEARWRSAVRDANNVREIYAAMLAASPADRDGGGKL